MIRKLVTIVTICIPISLAASAQVSAQDKPVPETISPQKQALIAELLVVTNSRKHTEEILNAALDQTEKEMPDIVWAGISESPLAAQLTNEEKEKLRGEIIASAVRFGQRFRELLNQRLDYAKLDQITAALYAKYFDENQLIDLITFYKSDTGKHTLDIMPKLFAESMARSQQEMMPIIIDLMREISTEETQKFQKEMVAIVESHHGVQKKPRNTKRRP